jgi:hypothetical protein
MEESGRASRDAQTSESMYGHPVLNGAMKIAFTD